MQVLQSLPGALSPRRVTTRERSCSYSSAYSRSSTQVSAPQIHTCRSPRRPPISGLPFGPEDGATVKTEVSLRLLCHYKDRDHYSGWGVPSSPSAEPDRTWAQRTHGGVGRCHRAPCRARRETRDVRPGGGRGSRRSVRSAAAAGGSGGHPCPSRPADSPRGSPGFALALRRVASPHTPRLTVPGCCGARGEAQRGPRWAAAGCLLRAFPASERWGQSAGSSGVA